MLRNASCGIAFAVAALGAAGAAGAESAALTDGQILQYVQTVNRDEIGDAVLALRRAKSDAVKSFARHMRDDHAKSERVIADAARKAKIKLANSDVTAALKNAAEVGDKELKAAKDGDFDKLYAQAEAKMHDEVASTIQSKLLPAATSDAVKSVLSETLSTVQEHQRMAQDLAGKL
jgi:putative membrane protein